MATDKLIAEVTELIEREYGRAGAKLGLTSHSDHESYAVILEELQEAEQSLATLKKALMDFWFFVKNDYTDQDKFVECKEMERRALLGACNLVQAAAMAKKAAMTVCDRGAVFEFKVRVGERE